MTTHLLSALLLLFAELVPVPDKSNISSMSHTEFPSNNLQSRCAKVAPDAVVLLHGLGRTSRSMKRIAAALKAEGFIVLNIDYPSRTATVGDLAEAAIGKALRTPSLRDARQIHFVTHSMGGILLRQYLDATDIDRLGRVVMLGPPNQGSEVVDTFGHLWLFRFISGPAGGQLGTGPDSVPNGLGPVNFDLGIIAGDRSINWINSMVIAGPDDGKVSVERTTVSGMKDHRIVHATHPFLMRNPQVILDTIHFLRNGKFPDPP